MANIELKSKKKRLGDDNVEIKQKKSRKSEDNQDWDIDNYRTDYESEEHWELRRQFMEIHKDKFPEERLVCLARVFTNIEFMGCRYPQETMRLVAELSKDVAKNFRESRESRLKRTFVAASDAAEQRAKGRKQAQTNQQQQQPQQNIQKNTKNNKRNVIGATSNFFEGLPYKHFVLYLKGGRQCLSLSAARCNINITEKVHKSEDGTTKVEIYLDKNVIISEENQTLKTAKAGAFKKAIELLQKNCFCIKNNADADIMCISKKGDNTVDCQILNEKKSEQKLDESNKGFKMMKMMGWTGGGLGASKQGRQNPVEYLLKCDRGGLGRQASKIDNNLFSKMLQNYKNSNDIRELRFESSFTKDERALLHSLAQKYNLKSHSYGNSEDRQLVISKKTISNETILREVLLNKNSAYCNQFLVQVPECKANLYPNNTEHLELEY